MFIWSFLSDPCDVRVTFHNGIKLGEYYFHCNGEYKDRNSSGYGGKGAMTDKARYRFDFIRIRNECIRDSDSIEEQIKKWWIAQLISVFQIDSNSKNNSDCFCLIRYLIDCGDNVDNSVEWGQTKDGYPLQPHSQYYDSEGGGGRVMMFERLEQVLLAFRSTPTI